MNITRTLGLWAVWLCFVAWSIGCGDRSANTVATPPTPPAPAPAAKQPYLDHAQPRLRTLQMYIGPHEITAEIAITQTEIATGMMFRETMEENEGMLFVFPVAHRVAFYMRNTRVPLSLAYFDQEGTILEIHDLEPFDETPVQSESSQIKYVLEMKQGWFDRHQIQVGAFARTGLGTLPETFGQQEVR